MNLLIRADASTDIGTGHVMRCLALAQSWLQATDNQVTFLMATVIPAIEARLRQEGAHVSYLSTVPGSQEDVAKTIDCAKSIAASWVVVDGYQFDADYQKAIKAAELKLLFFDDYGHAAHYWADLVLNQNVSAEASLYANRESYTKLLLGTRYVLLRKEFWSWRGWKREKPTAVKKVLVTLGGADSDNVTLKVIQALNQLEAESVESVVLVGKSNPNCSQLENAVQSAAVKTALKYNASDMPGLMAWADIAVSAGGSTCWELIYMQLPSLLIILAENQEKVVQALDRLGVAQSIGWHHQLTPETIAENIQQLIVSLSARKENASCLPALVDSRGAERVLVCMKKATLRLRRATKNDCELIWKWANEEEVRSQSFSSAAIPWETHVRWFNSKFSSSDFYLYIAIDDFDTPIGSIRFDIEGDEATVSISIDVRYRGQGYGTRLIELATDEQFRTSKLSRINAYIRTDNRASLKSFQNAGFNDIGTVTFNDVHLNQITARHLLKLS